MLGGRYRVIDRIGVGGMAEVFRAHDQLLARDVAVKVFRTQPAIPDTASGVERQEIELHALARLNHPNLITLFDGSITGHDGPAFLVMELINGPSLAARIDDGPLTEAEAGEVGVQIADALAYVHAEGMVHRDVKPANILLGTDRTSGDYIVRARLSDFGIVRLLDTERLTSVDFTLGTASYLAPEQARGSDVGPVADVYSLGLVLIEALTGNRSFEGPPVEALMARLARDPEIPSHLPAPWPGLLAAMTASDPAVRPNAAEVAQTLREARSGSLPLAGVVAAAAVGMAAAAAPAAAAATTADAAAGAAAEPDAQTVGFAAVGAAPAAAPTDPWAPVATPRSRWNTTWLLVAAGLVAALAIGGFLLLRPTSNGGTPAEQKPGAPQPTTNSASSGTKSSAPAPGNNAGSRSAPSATATATATATTPSAPPSSSDAPSTTPAPSSSGVPSTTAAPSSSGVPSPTASTTSSGSPTATGSSTASQGAVASTSPSAPGSASASARP